jgi:hypothetical protein
MLNQAHLPMILHCGVWSEVTCYATDMRNYLVTATSPTSSYEKFMGHTFDWINSIHAFVEMAIVEYHPNHEMSSKLQDHGKPALFVGTTQEHTRDTY